MLVNTDPGQRYALSECSFSSLSTVIFKFFFLQFSNLLEKMCIKLRRIHFPEKWALILPHDFRKCLSFMTS